MHNLLHARAWSRACQLVVDNYPYVRRCPDKFLRKRLACALFSIPSILVVGMESKHDSVLNRSLKQARSACAEINTQMYIARELQLIDQRAATWLIRESLDLIELLEELGVAPMGAGGDPQRAPQNRRKSTIFNKKLRNSPHS